MKTYIYILLFVLTAAISAGAQVILTYDQESASGSDYTLPRSTFDPVLGTNSNYVVAQSFTPSLSSVGFVRLAFDSIDNPWANRVAYVNLWSGSVGGTLLGTSQTILPPNWAIDTGSFFAVTNFFFASPIPVSPGTTYYLQVGLQPTTAFYDMYLAGGDYNYPGGEVYENGFPQTGYDLWFQEGTYAVSEPSASDLILLSGCVLFSFWLCRKRNSVVIKTKKCQSRMALSRIEHKGSLRKPPITRRRA